MFQYAAAYCLSVRNNTKLVFDLRLMEEYKLNPPPRNPPRDFDLDIFKIEKKIASKKDLFKVLQFPKNYRIRKIISLILDKLNLLVIFEKKRLLDKRILTSKKKNLYLDGYWQMENYFKDYREEILKIFNFKILENDTDNISFINQISKSNSVCLNVRRTDFINNPEHNVTDINYFKSAINIIKDKIGEDIELYIFSDDIDWCKKNFSFFKKKCFVEHKFAGNKFFNYLYLMTKFKNFIIPNSTFAWWAAWLSEEKNKIVIAPKKWSGLLSENLYDIIPDDWIKI